MAITSLCAKLNNDHDATCIAPVRKYFQQAVLINKTDIDTMTITPPTTGTCAYNVAFALKTGTKGWKMIGPEAGSNYHGGFDKSRSEIGYAQYSHNTQLLVAGNSEATKCIIDSLDKGSFVVALQLTDGTVEIFGAVNGLTTGDYTYNLQENGGGVPIILASIDNSPEPYLPLIYKSAIANQEGIDFDAAFDNGYTPPA